MVNQYLVFHQTNVGECVFGSFTFFQGIKTSKVNKCVGQCFRGFFYPPKTWVRRMISKFDLSVFSVDFLTPKTLGPKMDLGSLTLWGFEFVGWQAQSPSQVIYWSWFGLCCCDENLLFFLDVHHSGDCFAVFEQFVILPAWVVSTAIYSKICQRFGHSIAFHGW